MRRINLLLVLTTLAFTNLHAYTLNQTAIAICDSDYQSCVTSTSNSTACAETHQDCMDETAYVEPDRPQSCYVAEAKWGNYYSSIKVVVVVFITTTFVLPALLKLGAHGLNKAASHREEATCLGKCGKLSLKLFDADGDNKITAAELLAPQFAVYIGSILFPFFQYVDATVQQANCDFDEGVPLDT